MQERLCGAISTLTSGVVVVVVFFFLNMSRFPVLLQFHIKAKCATHHRHGL